VYGYIFLAFLLLLIHCIPVGFRRDRVQLMDAKHSSVGWTPFFRDAQRIITERGLQIVADVADKNDFRELQTR
jgi:hypothetical protein